MPACTTGALRLAGLGSNSSSGRVEMCYNGQWGTVCDYLWDTNEATIACKQLGYNGKFHTAIAVKHSIYTYFFPSKYRAINSIHSRLFWSGHWPNPPCRTDMQWHGSIAAGVLSLLQHWFG